MNQSEFMLQAVQLAEKGKGFTAPNPCVGALVVSGDRVLGRGWHRGAGKDHAEVEAINHALQKISDLSLCTLYVTLEPCNHHGKTPPCTQAVLNAGIRDVVIGTLDPNPGVQGGGAEYLKSRGVRVTQGVEEDKCLDLIADFVLWQRSKRAYLYLKTASTLDGRIAARTGHSKWVTSRVSRQMVHELRSRVGAVLVGGNTFYQDDPSLTCRLDQDIRQPLAIILTTRLPAPDKDYYLLRQRPSETVFWTDTQSANSPRAEELTSLGCTVLDLGSARNGLDLDQGLIWLRREKNVFYVLCEGGGQLALSLLKEHLADELWAFLGLKILGDEQGVPVCSGKDTPVMDQAIPLRLSQIRQSGPDLWLRMFPENRQ